MSYIAGGDGGTILLLHGWGTDATSWGPALEALIHGGYRIIAPDLPGFGRSDPPPQAWGVAEYADLVREFVLQLDLGPTYLIAHSFGGRVAIVLAADWPELIRRLILVGSAGVNVRTLPADAGLVLIRAAARIGRALLDQPMARFVPFARPLGEAARRRFYVARGATDYVVAQGVMKPTFSRVIEQDLRPYAERIRVPTLLIWGELDRDTPLAQGQELERLIPDSGLVVLPGAGHFSFLERLPTWSTVVREFFR